MGFFRRQLLTSALVVNALRPLPGFRSGIASFGAGMLASELAPHLLALTATDSATHALRHRDGTRDRRGLVLAGLNAAGLAWLLQESRRVAPRMEEALGEALGPRYAEEIDTSPTIADQRLPWRRLVYPFRRTAPGVHVESDIAYADHGRRGLLDVYRPAGAVGSGAPVLLQVHGGAWTLGSKDNQGIPLMLHLAAKGWVCVALNYRLAPRDPWPAQVVDVKQVIGWIREHVADYGGDPGYLAITGGSAGGHLASLAALTPNDPAYQPGFEDVDTRVDVAVPHYGVYDFAGASGLKRAEMMRDLFLAPKIVQRRFEEDPEVFEDASPLLRIGPDAPDFFVVHGNRDTLVPVEQARRFVARLRATSDAKVAYAELPGAQHAFDAFASVRSVAVVRGIDRFLHWHHDRHLRATRGAATGETGPSAVSS